jgi:nitric oxide reductase large subunit
MLTAAVRRTKAIHTNLLIVWVLTGFMGAAYYVVPEESRTEIYSVKLAYAAAHRCGPGGVTAVVGYSSVDGGQQVPRAAVPGEARPSSSSC